MTELLMMKMEDGLHPADDEARQAIRQVPENSIVKVKVSVPRNVRQFRLYHAMVNVVFQHQMEPKAYATREDLRAGISIALGHCHEVRNARTGAMSLMPNSTSFGAMDQVEWKEYFDAFKQFVLTVILPGVNSRDLDNAIADMLREPNPYER